MSDTQSESKEIRVFIRKTSVTPDDCDVRINTPPGMFDECAKVSISVTFSWDMKRAEELAKHWRHVAPVEIGGPALMQPSGVFVAGRFVRRGYTITSRGCPNKCWFCSVWRREGGTVREMPIQDGHDVLDDNLLACSDAHVREVFTMLERQSKRPKFTGGLEARLLKPWHCSALRTLKPERLYFACDTPDDLEPLRVAGNMLCDAGFTTTSHVLAAYVLCGWKGDTIPAAESRMMAVHAAGFVPMAMLYRDSTGARDLMWARWTRTWARASIAVQKAAQTQARSWSGRGGMLAYNRPWGEEE